MGSANTLKHSARLFLQVIDRSNRMLSLFSYARLFRHFLASVSERFPCMSLYVRGFSLGKVFCILVNASCMQSWGVQHCLSQSSSQSRHLQKFDRQCGSLILGVLRRADVWSRCAMVFVSCLLMRHLVVLLFIAHISEARWNHAGSFDFRCVSILIAAKFTLYILAALSILTVSSSRSLSRLGATLSQWRRFLQLCLEG